MEVIRDRERTVDLSAFLIRPLFAHLATASEDGPRESPVWFLWEDEALWMIGDKQTDTFPKRIQAEPRCAVGIVDFDVLTGRVEHIGMRGRAKVVPFDAGLDAGRARRLLSRYLGKDERLWDERFRQALENSDTLLVRFTPETVVVRDVSFQPSL